MNSNLKSLLLIPNDYLPKHYWTSPSDEWLASHGDILWPYQLWSIYYHKSTIANSHYFNRIHPINYYIDYLNSSYRLIPWYLPNPIYSHIISVLKSLSHDLLSKISTTIDEYYIYIINLIITRLSIIGTYNIITTITL